MIVDTLASGQQQQQSPLLVLPSPPYTPAAPPPLSSLFYTGSVTGLRPLGRLGSTYTAAMHTYGQPLCANEEGWGPLSPHRWDFTPCFIDVWIASVAAFGIIFGACSLAWLVRKRARRPELSRNLHFWVKQSLLGFVIADVLVQLGFQIHSFPAVWIGDFRVYTTVLLAVSLAVVFAIQSAEHTRIRHASGVVLFYWAGLMIALAVKLRSLVSQQTYGESPAYFVTYCIGFAGSALAFGAEWLWPRVSGAGGYEALVDDEECPVEYATVFSRLTFSWMTPMMRRGYQVFLTEDDLWALSKQDTSQAAGQAFQDAWGTQLARQQASGRRPSIWIALAVAYGGPNVLAAVFKVCNDITQFLQPQLLRYLIAFVDSWSRGGAPQPVIQGVAIAIGMFALSLVQTVMVHAYFQRSFVSGMRIKSGLASAIYRKSLRLSAEGRANKTTGDVVNHMAVDSQRLQDVTQYMHQLWSAPFQIVICMVSLYQLVGWSMMAGVAVMIVSMPAQGAIANVMKRLQKEQMKNKDARSRLMAEIINNMKSIKLYAWGAAFMNRLSHIRNERELRTLRKIGATQAFANFTWTTAPFFVSCLTFTVFVLTQDRPLTTEIVFPALTLFNLLTFPLAVLPMVISALVEASVAAGRLTEFLAADEIQPDAVEIGPAPLELGEESVVVDGGTFSWDRRGGDGAVQLRNISFRAYKGELSCIVGRVGSGKSTLLQSILGDVFRQSGSVRVNGTVAYVAQQPWILNATVRENIVFGYRYDAEFYDRAVRACALVDDFAVLPDGDGTVVGERGISLSGGQRARLALARAVYARADIYLLDDVLSAVDSHVGRHIIENVLGSRGLLASKTRILATNAINVLKQATYITMIRSGEVVEKGTYRELMEAKGQVADLVRTAGHDQQRPRRQGSSSDPTSDPSDPSSSDPSSSSPSETSTIIEPEAIEAAGANHESGPELEPLKVKAGPGRARPRTGSVSTLRRASAASFRGPRGRLTDEEVAAATADSTRTKQVKEHSEQGEVKWDVYIEYAKNSQIPAVVVYLFMLIAAQAAGISGSFWLKEWAESNQRAGRNADVGKYIGVYFAFGIGASILTMFQTLILWIFCSIEASRKLHERMATAIFRSPMSFFDTTPAGRIMNRFSSDIYRVDEVLARTFNLLFSNTARSAFTLLIISISSPAFIGLIVPICLAYTWIQRYYLRTSRELKRLDSVSRSPVYTHFQESLGGTGTIRAYRQQDRFMLENEWRIDANMRAYFPSVTANRWLAVRLELIGAFVILAAAGFPIAALVRAGPGASGLTAGMVGLAMAYALQITSSLNWIVRQTVEVETNIVSVERVLEYARLPSEAAEIIQERRPPVAWPARGAVEFKAYSTRYRENLDLVLKNVCVDIKSHEKIGVVGRTGAGKSSLTLALFRIIESTEGHIDIDGLDTSAIGLLDLRRNLAIIPQDAALFEGTVRDNLDPAHVHDDAELWEVLAHARLRHHVESMEGGLEAKINEGGSNLSQGQRQLISLARAMLTPSNILVLDEATASVDVETDALVQETLRSPLFSHRTIITIAHRINTIMDSDRVLVLDKGEVIEFDTPAQLLDQRGAFYGLVKQAGLVE